MATASDLWLRLTESLTGSALANATRVYALHTQGSLSLDEAIRIVATDVARAQRQITTANDQLLARELGTTPTGTYWPEETKTQTDRLEQAIRSTIAAPVAVVAGVALTDPVRLTSVSSRLSRTISNEVQSASVNARSWSAERIYARGDIKIAGWYRQLSADACDFCITIGPGPGRAPSESEGFVHALDHRIARHPGCHCHQVFVSVLRPDQKWLGKGRDLRYASGSEETALIRSQSYTNAVDYLPTPMRGINAA